MEKAWVAWNRADPEMGWEVVRAKPVAGNLGMGMPQGFTSSSARLTSRPHAFATNLHE